MKFFRAITTVVVLLAAPGVLMGAFAPNAVLNFTDTSTPGNIARFDDTDGRNVSDSGSSLSNLIVTGGELTGITKFSVGPTTGAGGTQINRITDRLYVGGALSGQVGNMAAGCGSGDWMESLIGNTTCASMLSVLAVPGVPYGGAFAARTSDNPTSYAFATLNLGVNDSPTAMWPVTTAYNETRAYYGNSPTIGEESDIINATLSNVQVAKTSPYSIVTGGPSLIVNKWLSNGRPDILVLALGGTTTVGDVVSFTFTGGLTSSPQTIQTTVVAGDTFEAIAARLSTAFHNNSVLMTGMNAKNIGTVVSVAGAPLPSIMTTVGNVTGAGTEQAVAGYGGNASAGIGFINNSTAHFGSLTGAYKTGIVYDCLVLEGADCTDTGGFGEAVALGRKQAIDFYTAGNVSGTPVSRIYSSQIAATTQGMSLNFADGKLAMFEFSGDNSPNFAVSSARTGTTDYVTAIGGKPGLGNAGGLVMASTNADANFVIASKGSGPLQLFAGSTLVLDLSPAGAASLNILGALSVGGGTNLAALTTSGHVIASGVAPVVSSCGASPVSVGNDTAGRVTTGSGVSTSCTITFASAYTINPPVCRVSNETSVARPVYPINTTISQLVITGASITAGDKLSYHCVGVQ